MNTIQAISNQAVGFKHLGPGAMTGVFKQQPAVERGALATKTYKPGACGAHVALQANTGVGVSVMAVGECGLSGVVCQPCLQLEIQIDDICTGCNYCSEAEAEEEPGLHRRG